VARSVANPRFVAARKKARQMKVFVLDDARSAARYGAARIAEATRSAVFERGFCSLALSGGMSPWPMFSVLAEQDVPWTKVHIFQVDERIDSVNSPQRTFAKLRKTLLCRVPLPEENVHPMPVDSADLVAAAENYEAALSDRLGRPPVLDLVHLGLGVDGHTASLIPGDTSLAQVSCDVAVSGPYEGSPRMTLTYSALNRARTILWLVIGEMKAEILHRLIVGDVRVPAGRIERSHAIVLADKGAASLLAKSRCRNVESLL
jgi:6-phosphogluconolactonase